ncbi:MAG: hypothetical protein ABIN97_03125 [Ginsengibacter sp.]
MYNLIDALMKLMYQIVFFSLFLNTLTGCKAQTKTDNHITATSQNVIKKIVGGGCDGCEIMYVDMPKIINSADTSAGWFEIGQKLLVTGTVYKPDSKTPAPNVIVYYYHTDNNGYYSPGKGLNEKAGRHGHIRGWVKTGEDGKYFIYTIRPSPYPNASIPAHIHVFIKEPDIDNEYYIDEFVFEDDKLLTAAKRKALENRGGNGIIRVQLSNNLQVGKHNIILGLNIPNYPETLK